MKLQTGLGVLGFCLLTSGCAQTRYSMREIREYAQAISLAKEMVTEPMENLDLWFYVAVFVLSVIVLTLTIP